MFLTTSEQVLRQFKKRLEATSGIRIATAWVTLGRGLDILQEAKMRNNELKIQVLAGTHGNATEPDALERLRELGKLRLVDDGGLFHPKVYIFRSGNASNVVWIGSANFTRSGFEGGNVEVIYETRRYEAYEAALEWFKKRWDQLEDASGDTIDDYRRDRENNQPSKELREIVGPTNSLPSLGTLGKPANEYKKRPRRDSARSITGSTRASVIPKSSDWTPVKSPDDIRDAFKLMKKTLIEGAEPCRIGAVYGTTIERIYFHKNSGIWCALDYNDPKDRLDRITHFNCFGLESNMRKPIIRLNLPNDGHHSSAPNCTGRFVRRGRYTYLACHFRSNGVGRKISDDKWPKSPIRLLWKRTEQDLTVLGRIDHKELRKRVFELVQRIAKRQEGDIC